jgi:hypothetical protein
VAITIFVVVVAVGDWLYSSDPVALYPDNAIECAVENTGVVAVRVMLAGQLLVTTGSPLTNFVVWAQADGETDTLLPSSNPHVIVVDPFTESGTSPVLPP